MENEDLKWLPAFGTTPTLSTNPQHRLIRHSRQSPSWIYQDWPKQRRCKGSLFKPKIHLWRRANPGGFSDLLRHI